MRINFHQVDWDNLRIVIQPISATPDEDKGLLTEMWHVGGDVSLEDALFFISDERDQAIMRVYIGEKTASTFLADAKETGMTYMETIQMRLMVSLMEAHILRPDEGMAKECVKYARTLPMVTVNAAFRHLDHFTNDASFGMFKEDVHAIIHFIQRNINKRI